VNKVEAMKRTAAIKRFEPDIEKLREKKTTDGFAYSIFLGIARAHHGIVFYFYHDCYSIVFVKRLETENMIDLEYTEDNIIKSKAAVDAIGFTKRLEHHGTDNPFNLFPDNSTDG